MADRFACLALAGGLAASLALGGCGVRGPLELPPRPAERQATGPGTAPAAQPPMTSPTTRLVDTTDPANLRPGVAWSPEAQGSAAFPDRLVTPGSRSPVGPQVPRTTPPGQLLQSFPLDPLL